MEALDERQVTRLCSECLSQHHNHLPRVGQQI